MDDVINTLPYNVGINADSWQMWRNDGDIGYIQLAFKVFVEALYDLILGEADNHISASYFFFGDEDESLYKMWATALGIKGDELPLIVERYKVGHVTQEDVELVRTLCTTMKTI